MNCISVLFYYNLDVVLALKDLRLMNISGTYPLESCAAGPDYDAGDWGRLEAGSSSDSGRVQQRLCCVVLLHRCHCWDLWRGRGFRGKLARLPRKERKRVHEFHSHRNHILRLQGADLLLTQELLNKVIHFLKKVVCGCSYYEYIHVLLVYQYLELLDGNDNDFETLISLSF